MKVFYFIIAITLLTLSASAGFWDNVKRTELYEMLDKSIPEMRISMPDELWKEVVENAQVEFQDERTKFKVDAKLTFVYEGNEEEYDIKLKLGGKSTTTFSKPGYNIKIKGKDVTLHGTKAFRLRSDQRDVSMMRSKITTDILQKSGLLATEVGYTDLYINDEYMGFWVVSDAVRSSWIKRKFGDNGEEIKTLYECNQDVIRFHDGSAKTKCVNTNKDYSDYMEPFNTFVDQVNAAKTRSDLEEIMDVDNFIKYMAWEWLMGSFDHFLSWYGHNLCWYKQPNDKWVYIPYDHDIELGQDEYIGFFPNRTFNHGHDIDFANLSFKEFELDHPIIQILINDDDTVFRELLDDIISKVFNPDTLLIHIDEVRDYIAPYVKRDRDSGAGKINKKGKDTRFNYQHFLNNTEYYYVYDWETGFRSYGLKDWTRRKYNYAAAYYGINTNSTDPNVKHKLIEPRPEPVKFTYRTPVYLEYTDIEEMFYLTFNNVLPVYEPDKNYKDDRVPVLGINQYIAEQEKNSSSKADTKTENTPSSTDDKEKNSSSKAEIETENTPSSTATSDDKENSITSSKTIVCWAEELGYKCCSQGCVAKIKQIDENGLWGVEENEWCGIPRYCKNICPGIDTGFSCCKGCKEILSDHEGPWGIEDDEWCSIKYSCEKEDKNDQNDKNEL